MGGGGGGFDLWRIKNGGLKFGKLQGAEFRFRELGLPGSRLLKNGEQQVDFALGKWRAQKMKQEGKQFLKMGQHLQSCEIGLLITTMPPIFVILPKFAKLRNFAKLRKFMLMRPGYWINLLPNFF